MTLAEAFYVGLGMGFCQGGTLLFFAVLADHYKRKQAKASVEEAAKSFTTKVEAFRKAFAEELAAAPTQRPPRDLS